MRLVAPVLPQHENEVGDKRVESILFPRLDEGSTPSWSTLTQRDARSRPASTQGRLHAYIASWGVGCTPFTHPYIYNGESRTLQDVQATTREESREKSKSRFMSGQ